MEEQAKRIAELLKVLANENRLMIVCTLLKEPMTVGKLSTYIPQISLSALSQHLSQLKAHHIVDNSKKGQHITYFIYDEKIKELIDVLKRNYCANENEVTSK